MREIKIFVIVAFIIGVIYYGVEPLAHHAMHPDTAPSDYAFRDLEKYGKFDFRNGDKEAGRQLFIDNCTSCHTILSQGAEFNLRFAKSVMPVGEHGGIVPPDLSNSGLIFNQDFLAHFIKDPARAVLLDSKFQVSCDGLEKEEDKLKCEEANEKKEMYPMNAFNGILSDDEIVNIVTFLKDIAPKSLSDKEVFEEACNRCHAVKYDKGQYDEKFFAVHNDKTNNLLQRIQKEGADNFSPTQEDSAFIDSLLAMAKKNEALALTEDEYNERGDEINSKTIESYGGLAKLVEDGIVKASFDKNGLPSLTDSEMIKAYLGNYAPDLSMMIRSKGRHELAAFINNPQKVPLIDIQNAIINGLVKNKQNEEIESLSSDLTQEQREEKIEAIKLKNASDYGVALPSNASKSEWQSSDDYTNMARDMYVMPFGKSMPRVGLTKEAETQVINYLETIGDSKKAQRDSLGLWIIGFFVLLSFLAYLWKVKIWRDLH